VHLGYESGVSLLAPTKNKTEMWFTDVDLLLYYRLGSIRFTVSPMAGWSSRNVDKWEHTHSSGRLKYGMVVNAAVFRNRLGIDIKLVLMCTSFGRAYTDVELGPASLGIAVAVYEW